VASLLDRAIAIDDVDEACLLIQNALGITDGGCCGMHINPENWANKDERPGLLSAWLASEGSGATPPPLEKPEGDDLIEFDVEFDFRMSASTRGYTISAKSREQALELCRSCVIDGDLDWERFQTLGGEVDGWDTKDGTDHDYSIDLSNIKEAS
jgi:hypothetical protein